MAERIARFITAFVSSEIRTLFKQAKTVVALDAIEIRRAPKTKEYGRVLIVIPRAVGTAVERNLIRRRIKALFYQEKLYDQAYDLLVLVKKGATTFTFQQLRALLMQVYEKNV